MDRVGLKAPWFLVFPSEDLATIRQVDEMLCTEDGGAVSGFLHENGALAAPLARKDNAVAEPASLMLHFGLPPLFLLGEAALDLPLDEEFLNVTATLGLPQRNEHVPSVAILISIYWRPRRAIVVYQNLSFSLDQVLKSYHIVLEKPNTLPLFEQSEFALRVD